MSVQEKIKGILESLGEAYMFENWATANIRMDKFPLPCVLNVLPVSGAFNVGMMQLRDKPNCMIAFMDKADFDFDGEQNDVVIEQCKERAKAFIREINKGGIFKGVSGDVRYSVFYDRLDVNVTGVVVEVQLEEVHGTSMC